MMNPETMIAVCQVPSRCRTEFHAASLFAHPDFEIHDEILRKKEAAETKYTDAESRKFLREIRKQYDVWKTANAVLKGPRKTATPKDAEIIKQRAVLFTNYKDFIDQQHYAEKFDSRSNLHSTVLEEFIFYLFRDLVQSFSAEALIGKAYAFKDIFFLPPSYEAMIGLPHARIERKDHDFAIGVSITAKLKCEGREQEETHEFQIPAVAIECKTYLDKTMLEGSSTAAEQLKVRNPNALYLVVSEWLKLTENINPRKFKVDQIYVLRKQKNTDREFRFLPGYQKNPIHEDVVAHLFNSVRDHLTSSWEGGVPHGLEKGFLL